MPPFVLVFRETALTIVFVLVYKSQPEDLVLTADLQIHVFFFFFFFFGGGGGGVFFFFFEDLSLYIFFFSVV